MAIGDKEFRELFSFDNKMTSNEDHAKLLLFFVTRVAQLRNDMTPEVISQRLHDWGYNFSPDEIRTSFQNDNDIRLSKQRKNAFEISPPAEIIMKKKIRNHQARHGFFLKLPVIIAISSIGVLLFIVAYHLSTVNLNVRDLSLPEFRKRIGFDEKTTSPSDRATYFLYFITQVTKLRDDMTPDVIEARLTDIGYTDINESQIQLSFQKDPNIIKSANRTNAYQINPKSLDSFDRKLELQMPKKETLTIDWLVRHMPLTGWSVIVAGLMCILSGAFMAGYKFGATIGIKT